MSFLANRFVPGRFTAFRAASPLVVGAFVLASGSACTITNDEDNDGDGQVDARETGTVNSALTDDGGEQDSGLAGRAAISASSRAELARVEDNGGTTVVDEAEIDASGSFSFKSARNDGVMLISTFDAEGTVIGQALVERGPRDNETISAQRISTESTVEALVYLRARQERAADDVNAADLRTRIDVDTAVAIARDDATDLVANVDVAASAVIAAQRARFDHYVAKGIDTAAVVRAQADAYLAWNASNVDAAATTSLLVALSAAETDNGVSQWDNARLESEASASARLVLDARSDVDERVHVAMARAAAVVEARVVGDAFVEVVARGEGRAQADIDRANEAAAELDAEVAAAVTLADLDEAFVDFRDDVRGDADLHVDQDDSILGLLDIGGTITELGAALRVIVEVGDGLEADVTAAAEATVTGNVVDEDALAEDVAEAYGDFRAELEASINASFDVEDADVQLMTQVLVLSEGSYR